MWEELSLKTVETAEKRLAGKTNFPNFFNLISSVSYSQEC